MKRGKKSPNNEMLRQVVPYITLIGVALAIFTIGFLIGRYAIPSAAERMTEVPESTTSTTEHTVPIIETTTTTTVTEVEWIEFVATAYCPCEHCCGEWALNRPVDENGEPIVYGASGEVLQQGVSVAADTSLYPMGTQLEIKGVGTYIVQDRGGAIQGYKLDIYFENHDDALEFGRQIVRVREVK